MTASRNSTTLCQAVDELDVQPPRGSAPRRSAIHPSTNPNPPRVADLQHGAAPMTSAAQPEPPLVPHATLGLKSGESIRIEGDSGQALMELYEGDRGPIVRLLSPDLEIEIAGALRISAATIALRAQQGPLHLDATTEVVLGGEAKDLRLTAPRGGIDLHANDDVDVKGERIRLNCDEPPMARDAREFVANCLMPGRSDR